MGRSVSNLGELLVRSRLLSADEVRMIQQAWCCEAQGPADVEQLSCWLVDNRYLTGYQAAMLVRGHVDHFFLGPYKLLDRIGKGQTALVYKAVHRLGQTVAVKVLPPSRAKDPRLLARFHYESGLALRLRHPHVVQSLETGRANGIHYLAMEYLAGETLQEVLDRQGRMTPVEAARLIHQALLGLQHLHECGLVHGNLEPTNLMVVPCPESAWQDSTAQATVKILDLSLSRSLLDKAAPAADHPRFAGTDYGPGALAYVAPEQARDFPPADIRSDIYSLGCILYHALAGQPPFPAGGALRHGAEVARPLKEFNPDIPNGLQMIVEWMTAEDPVQRYATPARAAQALDTFLIGATELGGVTAPEPETTSLLEWPARSKSEEFSLPPAPLRLVAESNSPVAQPPRPEDSAELDRPPFQATAAPDLFADGSETAPLSEGMVNSAATSGTVENSLDFFRDGPSPGIREDPAPQPNRRDYLGLVVGAGGLLLAEAAGWVLGRLAHGMRPNDKTSFPETGRK
jgi:serine/threonine protein kinase